MRLVLITRDIWQIAAAVDARGRCPVKETLDALVRSDRIAHAELLGRLDRLARLGPPRDERRSRHLGGNIFELKTPRGFRLLYFFRSERLIVCTELCHKPKPRELVAVVRRARRLRDAYLAAEAAGKVVIEREA